MPTTLDGVATTDDNTTGNDEACDSTADVVATAIGVNNDVCTSVGLMMKLENEEKDVVGTLNNKSNDR